MLQALTSLAPPLQYPPYFSVTTLDLVLYIVPSPHVLEQEENSLQVPHTQFPMNGIILLVQHTVVCILLPNLPHCIE